MTTRKRTTTRRKAAGKTFEQKRADTMWMLGIGVAIALVILGNAMMGR
jgi:hypothetical protein